MMEDKLLNNSEESLFTALFSRDSVGGQRSLLWQSLGYALLPLRLFLGFTFIFAGLQKLSNPNFFNPKSPISIQAQIAAYQRFSPLHLLLHIAAPMASIIGFTIAVGELAVGLGIFFGVMPRLAALGGMVISLMLFLTVSFHSNPYYTGADIVFLFALTPIAIGGTGGIFSLTTFIRKRLGIQTEAVVAIGFQSIQNHCGQYEDATCRAQNGAPCAVKACPVLISAPAMPLPKASGSSSGIERREFLTRATAVGAIGVVGVTSGVLAAFFGRMVRGTNSLQASPASSSIPTYAEIPTTTTDPRIASGPTVTTTTGVVGGGGSLPAGAQEIGNVSELPVGKVASFVDPKTQSPAYILHPTAQQYVAYSAICPHAGCTVQYDPNGTFVCPCHGSTFDALTGAVQLGPADRGLTPIPITISSNRIYADPSTT